ncbi:MAG TPA: hypothetical protein VLA89_17860 [Gemmatimonadales bacterium]|nr:hypothetical protein [Gemmatimonadales bacterium]
MPSVTGVLEDNQIELVAQLLGNLADLPFNAFFVDGVDIAVPEPSTSFPSVFIVTGSPWTPIAGSPWQAIRGHGWRTVGGARWPVVVGRPWPRRGGTTH